MLRWVARGRSSIGSFDLLTGALILGGACLIAASLVAAIVWFAPPRAPSSQPAPPPRIVEQRPAAALPPDRVAAVLSVDASAGAGVAARAGDHVDVLGYFSRQVTASEATTRVLVSDAPVLSVDRSGANVALTLAVPQQSAVLLQEAQAIGARTLVALLPLQPTADLPATFSDSDLASRFAPPRQ